MIDQTMDEWLTYWTAGYSSRLNSEHKDLLQLLKNLWCLVAKESIGEELEEVHFKALWFLGYELSHDRIISKHMSSVPIKFRLKNMIEDQGPLLFGFYTDDDCDQFASSCETFERLLRQSGLWSEFSQSLRLN